MRRGLVNGMLIVAAVAVLAVGGPWLVGQLRSLPGTGALAARADQKIVTLEVAGMTCAGCEAKVKQELTAVTGVSTAEVRHANGRAYVVCDPAVPDSALAGAVGRAGPGFMAIVAQR